jgi:dolichyl-phosphate beta-glucosyltransferase
LQVAHKYAKKVSSERLRVLTLEKNRGKGGAVRLGVLCARGRHILFADADGATTFSCVRQLETALCSLLGTTKTAVDSFTRLPVSSDARTAIAVGSRAHMERASMAQRSLARTILMLGFHALVRIFGGVHTVHDTQCGFKLFSRRAARLLFPQLHIERWAFDVELLYTAECLRIPIAEVQVEWEEIDGSKIVPVWSWLQMGRDLLLIWARYTFRIWTVEQEPPLDE